jgi:hypothetical protein
MILFVKSLFVAVNASSRWLNPNPGGLVANMTSKTQNCCDKFIIHQTKILKNV